MQWLIVHMWTALAATGLLALMLGWAVRGLRLRGRLRKAEGERNIALGSLEEKEAELEALYAAGRGDTVQQAELGGGGIHSDSPQIPSNTEEVEVLRAELSKAQAELDALREETSSASDSGVGALATATNAAAAKGAALATSADRLDAGLNKDSASLEWRNRYLESRVRSLEGRVQDLSQDADARSDDLSADLPDPSAVIAASAESKDALTESNVQLDKLRWQNDYLKQRMGYFERYGRPTSREDDQKQPPSVIAEKQSEEPLSTSEEEIAQLRWRNRYLEGRLAYYEGDKEQLDEGDSGVAELADSTAAFALSDEIVVDNEDEVEVTSASIEATVEQDQLAENPAGEASSDTPIDAPAAAVENDEAESTPAEAIEEIGIRPLALDSPVDGEGDDLTAIGGIGPKIQEVLNGLGIFHYDQIAAWTPENMQWVDDHLAFEGRIEREQWVQQAEALTSVD